MSMKDAALIAATEDFRQRMKVGVSRQMIAVMNETANEKQTLTVTGTPTGGTFTLASVPGSVVSVQTGTLTNAATTCTGLASTVGLFVGMAVTGTNIAAGTTVAAIVSATAVTLSANAGGTGAQTLTFSGNPVAVVNFNATAADVQGTLQILPSVGVGNVICTGGPLPGTPVVVEFVGTLGATPWKLMTVSANGLTGGSSPTAAVTRTQAGLTVKQSALRRAKAAQFLANLDTAVQTMSLGVADNATIQTDYPAPSYTLNVAEATVDNDLNFQISAVFPAYLNQ